MTSPETGALLARLTSVLREVFGDDDLVVGEHTTAADVEGWDSVANVEVMVALEREFGVRFKTAELAGFANVGALLRILAARAF